MNDLKPGYKTTEFGFSLALVVVYALRSLGVLQVGNESEMVEIATTLGAAAAAVWSVTKYVDQRTLAKINITGKKPVQPGKDSSE